jgi:RNA polymerase sigma-70 factor (ECF subfamily)
MPNRRDDELIQMFISGDYNAFEIIYHKYHPVIRSFLSSKTCHGLSMDDLIQETFTRLWINRERFRKESSLSTYIHGIAKFVWLEHRRSNTRDKKIRSNQDIAFENLTDMATGPPGRYEEAELRKTVQGVKEELGKEQKHIVTLIFIDKLSVPEASRILGCSIEELRYQLLKIRKHLQHRLRHYQS